MNIISIFQEKTVGIDVNGVVNNLNRICKHLELNNAGDYIEFEESYIEHPISHKKIESSISKETDQNTFILILTDKPYDNNYFYEEYNNIQIISFYDWDSYTDLSKENGLVYFVADLLAQEIESDDFSHEEKTGCIYDFLWDKEGIDDGMRQAFMCPDCLKRILKQKLSMGEKMLLDDLQKVMNDLSSASKWNKNILTFWEEQSKRRDMDGDSRRKLTKKRKAIKEGEISVLIASPSDVDLERSLLLNKLEREFRINGFEGLCKHRLIVHGWEDLASQTGYGQDLINEILLENVDVVVAVFKHKLGTPTIDVETGNERSESGTAEELLYAIKNNEKENPPLGMTYFFSKAPSPSFETPRFDEMREDWKKLVKFRDEIKNFVIYKHYNDPNELVEIVCKDLAQNINNYFSL